MAGSLPARDKRQTFAGVTLISPESQANNASQPVLLDVIFNKTGTDNKLHDLLSGASCSFYVRT